VDQPEQAPEPSGNKVVAAIKEHRVLFGGILGGVLGAIVGVIIALVLAGGGGGEAAPSGTTAGAGAVPKVTLPAAGSVTPVTSSPPVAGSDDEPPVVNSVDRNPLTGAPLATPSTNRVIAVKVDNAPAAGPPIGLQDAELVIETPVEGGLTRFTAMFFENEPQVIGPIRSVRPVDADMLAPWKPFLVTTGGQSFVYRAIRAAGIDILDSGTEGLFQQIERRQPYHLVATIPLVALAAGDGAPPVAVLPFGDGGLDGEPATTVEIPFSAVADVEWVYDSASDTYLRKVNGETFQNFPEYNADLADFSTDTVIVMMAAQRSAGYTDSAGADVPTFDVIGFGRVLVFNGGEVRIGQWLRSAQSDGWAFVDESGAQFTIPPGRVFLEVVPRFIDVTFS